MFGILDVSKLSGWLNAVASLNIQPMSVTLDVSRLSGWLNAEAPCQVTRRHVEGDTLGEGVGAETVNGGSAPARWRGGAPETCRTCS